MCLNFVKNKLGSQLKDGNKHRKNFDSRQNYSSLHVHRRFMFGFRLDHNWSTIHISLLRVVLLSVVGIYVDVSITFCETQITHIAEQCKLRT